MKPLLVRYAGGTLDGVARTSVDDQVPAVVCTSTWERYEATDKVYDADQLVEVTYRYTGRA